MTTSIDELKLSQTVAKHKEGLERLLAMWLDPNVLFYEDEIPEKKMCNPTVFLAGPTSRHGIPDYIWRKDAIHYLRHSGYWGKIIVPEPRGYSYLAGTAFNDFTDAEKIYQWERRGIHQSNDVVFWIPRNRQQLLGLTTNREVGQLMGRAEHDKELSEHLYIGWPEKADSMGSLNYELNQAKVGVKKGGHFNSLEDLCRRLSRSWVGDN